MANANVSIHVDPGDCEWSFGRRGNLGLRLVFVFPLHNKDFVANLVGVWNARLFFLVIVGDGLAAALHLQHFPFDLCVLPENHVHAEGELAGIVGQIRRAGCANCPCAGLDEMVHILVPIINDIDGSA